MPSCFFEVSVRTRQKHQSAHCAPLVQIFWPLTSQWSPLILALRLQGREVRAGARFGEALAPADLAARDRRDVLALLRLGSVLQQGRAEHHHAHAADRIPGAGAAHLLGESLGLLAAQAAAAVGLRPSRHAPSFVGHRRLPGAEVGVVLLTVGIERQGLATQARGEMGRQPVARFAAEGFEIGAAAVAIGSAPRTQVRAVRTGSGRPSTRLATTLRLTSEVPPSIELPLERSQPREAVDLRRREPLALPAKAARAHGLDHQLRALLRQRGGGVFDDRGGGRGAVARAALGGDARRG